MTLSEKYYQNVHAVNAKQCHKRDADTTDGQTGIFERIRNSENTSANISFKKMNHSFKIPVSRRKIRHFIECYEYQDSRNWAHVFIVKSIQH